MRGTLIALITGVALVGCAEAVTSEPESLDEAGEVIRSANADIAAQETKADGAWLQGVGPISSGQTSVGDFGGEALYLYWTFEAAAGEDVTLVSEGADDPNLDTFLLLYPVDANGSPTGYAIAYNDDFGGALSSRIEHTIDATGEYAAVVRRYDRAREGRVAMYLEIAGREVACGARLGDTCAEDEFCSFTLNAMCGWADATGVCETRPEICTREYMPVCGCDGVTYSNACGANAAGTSVVSEGSCEEDLAGEGEECSNETPCAAGLVCGGLTTMEIGWCVDESFAGSWTVEGPIAIPDNDASGVSSTIDVAGLATVPTDITLHLEIDHTWRGDLRVTLQDPGGQVVTVLDREGGSADDVSYHAPVLGFSMDDMVNGPWTLSVTDNAGQDVGTIDSWGLDLISRWD